MRQLKQKKMYEKMLKLKHTTLNNSLMMEQQQISNALAGDINPERRAAAKRRRNLKQQNGTVHEDARIDGMVNRPCFTNCEKKSWCDPSGWCDTNYYCTPSNREGSAKEPNMKDQKCVPVNKKTKGGRKYKRGKTFKRRHNKRKTTKRGGMRRRMDNKMVNEYQNPHKLNRPNDCCPCVFKLLGMPIDQVLFYQDNFGSGFTSEALVEGMNSGFPEYNNIMWQSPDLSKQSRESNNQLLEMIFNSIPAGTAAVGGIERMDGTKHCIAFAVTDFNQPVVFDAQVGRIYHGVDSIINQWLGTNGQEPNLRHIYILNSIRKDGSNLQLILDISGNDITLDVNQKALEPYNKASKTIQKAVRSYLKKKKPDDKIGGKKTRRKKRKRMRGKRKGKTKRKRKRTRYRK